MNRFYKFILFSAVLSSTAGAFSQNNFPYSIQTEKKEVKNLPGLHSFAMGHHNDKVLIIGGRIDGLHARQPFNTFPRATSNDSLYVLDTKTWQISSSGISELTTSIQEQFLSTNMNFCQVKDTLYIIGGYGYSDAESDHITFSYLTTIDVPKLISAIESGKAISNYIKQSSDQRAQNTGGQLLYLDGYFYLVGGQIFTGRYNPMGHNTYTQSYVTKLQKFTIGQNSGSPAIQQYSAVQNDAHLRRRDYNLLPQIFPDGSKGFMVSSGVFQESANLPFLYAVDILSNTITARTKFSQFLSHYHSAKLPLFDSSSNSMYSLFLGGMSQYYYDDTLLKKDDNVPFVKTISLVERNSNNELSEYSIASDFSEFVGASAEFHINPDIPQTSEGIVLLDQLNRSEDSVLLGYMIGGISSNTLNPFSQNQTQNQTSATKGVYKIYLKQNASNTIKPVAKLPEFGVHCQSPSNGLSVEFSLSIPVPGTVKGTISDENGKIIHHFYFEDAKTGSQKHSIQKTLSSGIYHLTLTLNNMQYTTGTFVVVR